MGQRCMSLALAGLKRHIGPLMGVGWVHSILGTLSTAEPYCTGAEVGYDDVAMSRSAVH